MSAPIQNVYFYNPATIVSLQADVTALKNQVGYGQEISTNTASYLTTGAYYLQNRAPAYAGTGGDFNAYSAGPYVNGGHPGYGVLGGNFRTGEEYFGASSRPVNGDGDLWNKDTTVYNFGSSGKILVGLACAKMMEEGIINDTDTCVTYYPAMQGTGFYYDTVTVSSGAAFPYSSTSYTSTTGTFMWQSITVADLLHYNIGLIDDFFTLPAASLAFTNTEAAVIANSSAANSSGLAELLQFNTYATSLLSGTPVGAAGKMYNGSAAYPTTSLLDSLISDNKNGTLPLAYKPASYRSDVLPYNIRGQLSTYDSAYFMLGCVLDGAVKAAGYDSFASYVRTKFLTPLGMSNTYVMFQETIPSAQFDNLADNAYRRSPAVAASNFAWLATNPFTGAYNTAVAEFGGMSQYLGALAGLGTQPQQEIAQGAFDLVYTSFLVDPSYATGCNTQLISSFGNFDFATTASLAAGQLSWCRGKPLDGISNITKSVFYYTGAGTGTNYPLGNSPIISTLSDFSKLVKLIGNRGVTASGERLLKTETWNYFIAPKINPLSIEGSGVSATPYGSDPNPSLPNGAYLMGCYRTNRDLTDSTLYGFDESTIYGGGATGNCFYVDFYTGNYFIFATPELGLSTGAIPVPPLEAISVSGSATYSKALESYMIKQLIKN